MDIELIPRYMVSKGTKETQINELASRKCYWYYSFSILAFWAYLFNIINQNDYANPGGDVTIYDNDLLFIMIVSNILVSQQLETS